MAIIINGTTLSLQPTSHGWIPKALLGTGGAGHPFYSPVQEYELNWELIPAADSNEIIGLINAIGVTGTAVCELPQYGAATYSNFAYSGCILNNLEVSNYFEEHTTTVRLVISNIRI